MQSQIRLGSVFGVRIGLHYSWFFTATLVLGSLASEYHYVRPGWRPGLIACMSVATTVCFFLSIVLHELAHALVARARGLPVDQITLFALGGISVLGKQAITAADEFWITIVGPATSILIAGISMGLATLFRHLLRLDSLAMMFGWLGLINLVLAIFNLLPAYPMDGGRMVRAVVWHVTGDVTRATVTAVLMSKMIAAFFIASGVLQVLAGNVFQGIWIMLMGWYLTQSADSGYREAAEQRRRMERDDLYIGDLFDSQSPQHK